MQPFDLSLDIHKQTLPLSPNTTTITTDPNPTKHNTYLRSMQASTDDRRIPFPHRPTPNSILQVRSILHQNFSLPFEIIALILDYARYWVLTAKSRAHFSTWDSTTIIAMPPLGATHGPVVEDARGRRWPKIPVWSERPCREIRISFHAETFQLDLRAGMIRHRGRDMGWIKLTPGTRPIVVQVVRGDERVWGMKGARSQKREEVEEVAVLEDPLERQRTLTDVVWRCTDTGKEGDLVRSLKVGDSVQLRTNMQVYGWGVSVPGCRVELYYAV